MNEQPTIREACAATAGYAAGDLRFTNLRSVNACRLRSSDKNKVARMNTMAKPTGGYVREASLEPQLPNVLSKSARRKAARYGKLPKAWR